MDDLESKLSSILNDPDSMEQIMSMAKALAGPQTQNTDGESPPAGPGTDILRNLSGLSGLIGSIDVPKNDKKALLLNALEPYLEPQRIKKARHALEMMSLAKVARAAMAQKLGGDDAV